MMSSQPGNSVSESDENVEMSTISTLGNVNCLVKQMTKIVCASKNKFVSGPSQAQQLEKLLNEYGENVFTASSNGKNIFHLLAEHLEQNVELLTALHLDPEGNFEGLFKIVSIEKVKRQLQVALGSRKQFPIHLAVNSGFVDLAKVMLKLSPSPDLILAQNADRDTPLHIAAKSSMAESLRCTNLIIETAKDIGIVNEMLRAKNKKGQSPFHSLCYKVPDCINAKSVEKLEAMLNATGNAELLKEVDGNGMTPLHLLCDREIQGKDADLKDPNLKKLFIKVVQVVGNMKSLNMVTDNNHKYTILHILAKSQYSKFIEIVMTQDIDVMITDADNKMPIHYPAKQAAELRNRECVIALSNWEKFKSLYISELELELIQDKFLKYILCEHGGFDRNQQNKTNLEQPYGTVLALACKSKSTKTVKHLLETVYTVKTDFNNWFSAVDKDIASHPMFSLQYVYENTPGALKNSYDNSIKIEFEESNENDTIFSTNYSVVTALQHPINESGIVSELHYIDHSNRQNWPENVGEELLLHPLTQCVTHALWQKLLPCRFIWFLWNIAWLISYLVLVPLEFDESENRYPLSKEIVVWILGLQSVLHIIGEIATNCLHRRSPQMPTVHKGMIWLSVILTIVVVREPLLQSCGVLEWSPPNRLQTSCATVGMLLTLMLIWRNSGLIYLGWGVTVEYYVEALKIMLKVLLCFAIIILGFQRVLSQHFPKHFSTSSSWFAFAKTFSMMNGEFNFSELFNSEDYTFFEKFMVFILFIFLHPLTLVALITGIVVERVIAMQRELEMNRAGSQIRLLNYLQQTVVSNLILFKSIAKHHEHFFISSRKSNKSIEIDQEVKWFLGGNDNLSSWSTLCHYFGKCHGCGNPDLNLRCGSLLPRNVKTQIRAMNEMP